MKFRVYDKQEKKYVSNDNIVLKTDGLLYRAIVRGVIEFLELDPDRYVVEMSTGLNDKNGVEIFEGDVLDCHGVRYYISLQAGRAYELRGENCKEDRVYFLFYHHKILETIGTIHDNGEDNDKI